MASRSPVAHKAYKYQRLCYCSRGLDILQLPGLMNSKKGQQHSLLAINLQHNAGLHIGIHINTGVHTGKEKK